MTGDTAGHAVASWTVLVNPEGQYGIYPASREVPTGWQPAGFTGTEDECVAYVDEHWTDMRPESLRRSMATAADMGRAAADAGRAAGRDGTS